MASATASNRSSTTASNQTESSFTTTDFDVFPPLPTLLSANISHSPIDSNTQEMSAYTHVQKENERLKAELIEIRSQRQTERQAYTDFIKSIEPLYTHLPSQARTPAMRLAFKNMVDCSRAYRDSANVMNLKYDSIKGISLTPSPEKMRPKQDTIQSNATPLPGQPAAHHVYHPTVIPQHRQMAFLIKDTLEQLQLPRPLNSQPFNTTLGNLKNNIASFTPFIVLYLNGRHRHFTSGLRAQINTVIGGLFADPEDARRIIDKIMKVLKDGVRYVDQDVHGLGGDIIGPMSAVLWGLVALLDNEAGYRD